MKKVSVIVRCYNEADHIGRLLSGIVQQSHPVHEIIVVDSGSTDGTLEIAKKFPVEIKHIAKENFSFGRSLNIGCQAASGEFLLFASAHVYPVYDDWISELLKPFDDDRVACVYGKQRGNEITKFSESQIFSRWFPEQNDFDQSHPFCNNANAVVRKSVWLKQPYDEGLTGLEDIAWAQKAVNEDHKIAYAASAVVKHVHDESAQQILNRYRREAIAMKAIYPNEKFTAVDFLHMFNSNVISDCMAAKSKKVFWRSFPSIVTFRLMQAWGTFRGYSQVGQVSKALRQKFYYPSADESFEAEIDGVDSGRVPIEYGGMSTTVARRHK